MISKTLDKFYHPKEVEERCYMYWEGGAFFTADPMSSKDSYSIVIPPPNITGKLHIGHALDNTLQDIICRYKRMRGFEVFWLPGTDHAGIATQNVVEREIAQKGLTRHDIGRERFIKLVWRWKKKYGDRIITQLKRLGASCDWSRERFTMDDVLSRAVREVFVHLYEEGLIYQGDYIINWCPRCHTALSDIESEYEEIKGKLYYIRYPFINKKGCLTVATTRPETMLGDTAIAVNPTDPRYLKMPDNKVVLPLIGRELSIIRDDYVSLNFGTGVLKVTPAHDLHDFNLGHKYDLEFIRVIDNNGYINDLGGVYTGLERFQARKKILNDLQNQGFLEKQQDYLHAVGHCYRCKTIIEPILSKQWFVRVKPLAEQALKAVSNGETRIIPMRWTKIYYEWMENIRDWCISRQIWWGHRIPVWYCSCSKIIVSRSIPDKCPKCGGNKLRQDDDVLDTWFSSGLWPFSTLGWPNQTSILKKFYPISCLITGFDILFFWVARMMMMGIKFMGEAPFKDICIHALICDMNGQKMSKSKGNVIDPIVIMDKYGTDAFRFALAALTTQSNDIKVNEELIVGYRNFVNKIWNAARFILMNINNDIVKMNNNSYKINKRQRLNLENRWILSRTNRIAIELATVIDDYRFNDAASLIYQFVWHEFCDWYLELAKISLYNRNNYTKQVEVRIVLIEVFSRLLRMLHPFMPFVTEELWQNLPGENGSLMKTAWPFGDFEEIDLKAEVDMGLIMDIINAVRSIRAEIGISPGKKILVLLDFKSESTRQIIFHYIQYLYKIAQVSNVQEVVDRRIPDKAASVILSDVTIYIPLVDLVDFSAEIARLSKEITKFEKKVNYSYKKITNKVFLIKAPDNIIQKEKDKIKEAKLKISHLYKCLEKIKEFL